MKRILIQLGLFLIVISFCVSCKKENWCDCIKRTGSITTEVRDIQGFDKLFVEDNVSVFLTQDAVFSVKVEAGKNIVPLIKTEVSNGTLTIKNNNRCNWTRSYNKPINVYISMPSVNYIMLNGTGKIMSLNTITTDSLDVQTKNSGDIELSLNNRKIISRMYGVGDVILHGTTSEHSCDVGGSGYLRAADLVTNYTYVHTFTIGSCYVNCSSKINCKIDYKGDVFCYGNPAIVSKIKKGSGELYFQ